jgi:hypothetical protein
MLQEKTTGNTRFLMTKLDKACAKIRATRGLSVRVAEACGIERAAVYQWDQVPIQRVHQVAEVIGMTAEQIRPDFFRKTKRRRV